MRILGLTACGLLLAACTSTVGGTPEPVALTSTAALGDLRTVDYCTMFDDTGGAPVSSFERCTAEVETAGTSNDSDECLDPTRT